MILYWTLYAAPLLAGVSPFRLDRFGRRLLAWAAGLALVVVIGTRRAIGCDWGSYVAKFNTIRHEELGYALGTTDPAYALVNWLVGQVGLGIHAVNVVCAAIFVLGLVLFCRRQPSPLLAAAVAVPYLVIVVSMGYTRQATAIGLMMLAYNAFADRRRWVFLLFVLLAATFHRSAVAFAPLAAFVPSARAASTPAKAMAVALVAAASSLFLAIFVGGHVERYASAYVLSEYESAGDLPRIALNGTAAVVFFLYSRRWRRFFDDAPLYGVLSAAALATIPLMVVSSVGADRLSLYLIPLQMAAFSRLPDLVHPSLRLPARLGVALSYAAVLFVWLTYGHHATCWVPYRSSLF
jgi:hypothetical protein